jgi:hypothetical protein
MGRATVRSITLLLAIAFPWATRAATITVVISGTTGEIQIGEGPAFGHKSYQVVSPGDAFTLTYKFNDEKGKQTISATGGGLITQSQIENNSESSPGTQAVLQIGDSTWEFGTSTESKIDLKTSAGDKGEQISYRTRSGGNRISAKIIPAKGGYWPKDGDWRATFTSTSLDGSTASFSADNDRVSAKGSLVPATIAVSGVDMDGQWLRSVAATGSVAHGERTWQLAHASPRGGYIVEQVSRTIVGSKPDGGAVTPSFVRYWQAWKIPAGSDAPQGGSPVEASDSFLMPEPAGSTGEDTVVATARFYEGLTLPPAFAAGNSPHAGGRLSSTIDPTLDTGCATLPVENSITLHF